MRASAWMVGFGCVSIAFCTLCGCSWRKLIPADSPTLPNAVAVDRALHLCSLSEGDQPFHLVLEISPPAGVMSRAAPTTLSPSFSTGLRSRSPVTPQSRPDAMRATIEIFWLNSITYRTEIQSPGFRQTRIVNGHVIEEHNTGDYYPRWIQDFVEALLAPVPESKSLRRVPGKIPIGLRAQACISTPPDTPPFDAAQLCFSHDEPRIAGITNPRRSLWYDDYSAFGSQQIARTIIDNLQPNLLVRGHVVLLEHLKPALYPLIKATRFTPPLEQLATATVSADTAHAQLAAAYSFQSGAHPERPSFPAPPADLTQSGLAETPASASPPSAEDTPIYIRTDRAGRVREAYRSPSDHYGLENAALLRAFALRFKPLIVNGAPSQMEALLYFPRSSDTLTAEPPRLLLSPPPTVRSTPGFGYPTDPSHVRPALHGTRTQVPSPSSAPQTAGPDRVTAPAPPHPDTDKELFPVAPPPQQ